MTQKEQKSEKKKTEMTAQEMEQLQEQYKSLQEEKQKLFEQLQRLSADYANYKKRTARQIADAVAYEKRTLLRTWLSSLDNLEHALASVPDQTSPDALSKLIEGLRMVYEHMLAVLQSQGVRKINPLGQPFTPGLHEALMTRTEPEQEDNIVMEVHQSGYLLGDEVLRPAKVVVNKLPAPPQSSEQMEGSPEIDSQAARRNEPEDN